ncbi:putative nucleotidyltransferases [Candidatus Termititenax persephonae]|uniref:Nucleotidyltransferases n=1 Tax=Candidatus Termititenax persephonae TaxID=2218525 RepID=A0A388TIF0_9BACT|nr:putative nucleotidyltransferases [Candidatus Termititenax persephonae]
MKNETLVSDLVENLKPANPYKIVLFGSCARDEMTADSDIDLMVVLDNDDVAKTYEERAQKELAVCKLVRDINYKVALDILVYSKKELSILKDYGNFFIEEVEKTGKVIYEKGN